MYIYFTRCKILFLSLLMVAAFLTVEAQEIKNKTITLSIKNGSLADILKSIQEMASVQIVFNRQLVEQVMPQTVDAKNEKLPQLLDRVLKGTKLTYTFNNDVIIIQNKPAVLPVEVKVMIVRGVVRSQDRIPLAVVTITNLTTKENTRSDQQGHFVIHAKPGDHLEFSHVGYKTHRETIRKQEELKIMLVSEEASLDEVVITGYQVIDKRLSAGSIYALKGKEVAEPNMPNIASMLQGKVPGLAIETISGSPNSIPRMRIRGTSTLMGNASPIWVVDGIVREDPVDVNPDNILGMNPSALDQMLRAGLEQASADLMGNSISGINVNDIESITFLKDAAATAIYGTRAANGVIVITTKKGHIGLPKLGYSSNLGFVMKPSYNQLQLMDSKERVQFSRELNEDGLLYKILPFTTGYEGVLLDLLNRNISEEQFNNKVAELEIQNTDWFDVLFHNAFNNSHSLSLSGGAENTTYRSSIAYGDYRGAGREDRSSNINGTLSVNSQVKSKLNVDFKLDGSHRNATGYNTVNPEEYAIRTSRTIHPDLFYQTAFPTYGSIARNEPLSYNILNEIAETGSITKNSQVNASLSVRYTVLPSLVFTSLLGGAASNQSAEQYATERSFSVADFRGYDYGSVIPGGPEESLSALPFGGILNNNNTNQYNFSFRNSLNFSKSLFAGRDQLTLFGAQEIRSLQYQGYSQYQHGYLKDRGEKFAVLPDYYHVFQPRKENKVVNNFSVMGSANYGIINKYILNVNMRVDANNRFGQYTNSRFLPVWSVAARWNIDEEVWLKNSRVINELYVNTSYGSQGNVVSGIGPDLILQIPEFGAINPLAKEYVLNIRSLAYPDLKWEKTKSYNAEVHIGLFDSFVNLSVGTYFKETVDALTRLDIPSEYGTSSMYINGGIIINKGIEGGLNLNLIRKENWSWSIAANASKNSNRLQKGASNNVYNLQNYLNGSAQLADQAFGTFYVLGYKGLNPQNGLPLFDVIDDVSDPKSLKLEDFLIKAGNKHHDLTGGLNTHIRHHNWFLNAQFAFSVGAWALLNPLFMGDNMQVAPTADQNVPKYLKNRWRKPGDELFTNIPGFISSINTQSVNIGSSGAYSRYMLYDQSDIMLAPADFLKLRSLSVGFQVPINWAKKMQVSQASLNVGMSNVFTLANKLWKGQDPEVRGVGTSALPQVPAYNLSINVSF